MQDSQKRKLKKAAKKAAKAGASGIGAIVRGFFKVLGTLILIGITTGMIVACIFMVYMKNNLTTQDLDIALDEFSLNLTSTVYCMDSSGNPVEIASLESSENRIWVDYEDIPKDFEHALVAIEDQRFYRHHGVDWFRTAGAFVNMFLGMKDTFGGSTITQQVIKNYTQEKDVTVQRKLTEIFRALECEKRYEKKDIIEWYLNMVYFGHKNYGIGAAAEYYFGKEVSELTLAEMASIVGITNNPSLYSPYINPERNKERQELILSEMYSQHYISYEEYEQAKNQKLEFSHGESKTYKTPVYSYFVDAVIEDAIAYLMEARDISYNTAEHLLFTSGYQIYTTMDPVIQGKIDAVYENLDEIPVTKGSNQQLQSAIIVMDQRTGNIVGMSGGVGEKTTSRGMNRATSKIARRPAGSSIKPIAVYAPAMDLGLITPDTRFEDEADIVLAGKPNWLPYNDDRKNRGVVTIRQAVVSSLNVISAQVLDMLTPQTSYEFLTQKLDITSLEEADCDYAPLALGQLTTGITVREMAAAYCIFPNKGIYTAPRTFTKICDSDGKVIYENKTDSHAAISESTAYWMTDVLNNAVNSGTGTEAKIKGMSVAGKTGTTSSKKDRWFCGFTPYYTAAVWTGYDKPEKINVSGNPAAQLWKKVMSAIHEGMEDPGFTKPADTYLAPVPGVDPAVGYSIRGVATNAVVTEYGVFSEDEVLYAEEVGQRAAGRTVTVTAKELEGYTLVSPAEATITLSDDPLKNVAEFRYVSDTVPIVEPDPELGPTLDPEGGIVDDPGENPTDLPPDEEMPDPGEIAF